MSNTNPPSGAADLTLHGVHLSGHCHKVELMLHLLGLPYRFVDAPAAVRASAEFRALNPLGQIPVLQDGALVQSDSNAILVYLAARYAPDAGWLGADPVETAAIQRWLSIAANEVKHGPAAARVICLWNGPGDLAQSQALAQRTLAFVEQQLAGRDFLAAARATVADLACYSYLAHAPEGGVALEPYPAVRAWLRRIEALPGFVPMPRSAPPAAS